MKNCLGISILNKTCDVSAILELAKQNRFYDVTFYISNENEEMKNTVNAAKLENVKVVSVKAEADDDDISKMFYLDEQGDNFIFIRSCTNILDKTIIEELVEKRNEGADIVTARKPVVTFLDKLRRFLFKSFSWFAKVLFGFEMYDGEYSILLLTDQCVSVLKAAPEKIIKASKLDLWIGYTSDVLISESYEKIKQKRKNRMLFWLLGFVSGIILVIALHITLSFALSSTFNVFAFHLVCGALEAILLTLVILFAFKAKMFSIVGNVRDVERNVTA